MLATQVMGLLAWAAVGVCCADKVQAVNPFDVCPHATAHSGAACPLHAAQKGHHDANTDECALQCVHDNEIPSLLTTAGIVPVVTRVEPRPSPSTTLPASAVGLIDIVSLPDSPPPRV